MKLLNKTNLIISLIVFSAGLSSPVVRAEEDKEHEKEHQMIDSKILNDWKSTMKVISSSADEFLDMGDSMIKAGKNARDPAKMQKGAELLKMGIKMSKKSIDYDHEYLAEEIPHEIMHKNHMKIKTKLTELISQNSKDFIALGEEFVKNGKSKNDSEMLMKGAKLLNAGMEMQMMNLPQKK